MIYKVTFFDEHGHPIQETTYHADDLREALELHADGTVIWPEGTCGVKIELVPAP